MFAISRRKVEKRAARTRGLRRWIRYRLEYVLVRCATTFLLCFSTDAALRIARAAGRLAYLLDVRHRRVGLENLDRVYGDSLGPDRKRALLAGVYESLALVPIELLLAGRLVRADNLGRFVDTSVEAECREFLEHPRGGLIATAHLGNWEVAAVYFALRGYRFHAVARPLDNPLVGDYLSRLRRSTGEVPIAKLGALQAVSGVLGRKGTFVAVPLDQNAGSGGTFVEFLGHQASTNSAALLLARRRKVPVLVGAVVRVAPMRFRLVVADHVSEAEVRRTPILELTQRVSDGIARLVRDHPEQWMWTHRRWKSRPAGELEGAARP